MQGPILDFRRDKENASNTLMSLFLICVSMILINYLLCDHWLGHNAGANTSQAGTLLLFKYVIIREVYGTLGENRGEMSSNSCFSPGLFKHGREERFLQK